jgi:alcohol dehydrogenase, propanol-preferring
MAIQIVKAISEARIIVLDLDDNKLKAAKENGVDITINSKKEDPVKSVMEVTDKLGADAVIDLSTRARQWKPTCNY